MSNSHTPTRSLKEWMDLIIDCRKSGLSDAAWCELHGIPVSSFYNAATRLRKKACEIPDPVGKSTTLDLTSGRQEVVRVDIQPERVPAEVMKQENLSPHLDNSHTIELKMDGVTLKVTNSADPLLIGQILQMIRPLSC